MKYYGYAGGTLWIDLTDLTVRKEPLDMDVASNYLGGMGMNGRHAGAWLSG